MADINFLKKLIDFDKEHINELTLKKIKTYIDHSDFDPSVNISPFCLNLMFLNFFS